MSAGKVPPTARTYAQSVVAADFGEQAGVAAVARDVGIIRQIADIRPRLRAELQGPAPHRQRKGRVDVGRIQATRRSPVATIRFVANPGLAADCRVAGQMPEWNEIK